MIAIAWINLVRLVRDRMNIFVVAVFPIILILVLGLSFGGEGKPRLGVTGGNGPLATQLVSALAASGRLELVRVADEAEARDDV
ncbi:MAG: ABC transporter permease, partial [Nonomuraea sp.]|nr:ABC transporter permease [Nonomuraea sp.]